MTQQQNQLAENMSSSSFEGISLSKTKETPPPYGGLCLDPPERIEFKQQNSNKNYVKLIIKNPTQKRIAFSINATSSAPKRYRIRPSRSILYPGQSEKVEISLRSPVNNNNSNNNDGTSSSSTSTKFDFKNDRFEVKYFYFDEHEIQQKTATDTDTISILENQSEDFDDDRIELDRLNIISVIVSILLVSIFVYFLLKSTYMFSDYTF